MGSDALRAWAGELPGVDDARFERCLVREEPLQRVERDQALTTQLGANGTPTFFINGRKLVGAQPLEAFSALIEEELARAKASGIPAREHYQRTVEAADGR
jgi:protein-disulfide isomerase